MRVNRNILADERLQALELRIAKERNQLEILEPFIQVLLGNKLCKNLASKVKFDWWQDTICLSIYNYDLPTVIDHVCGPFHRTYGVDWTCEIPHEGTIQLTTMVCRTPEADRWHRNYVKVQIYLYEESMRSCTFIRVPVRTYTKEEHEAAIRAAQETTVYENRIDCSED